MLRGYWLAGGRWGFTACDRRGLPPDPGGGCGAAEVATVPFAAGWGALAAIALGGALVAWAWWRPGRAPAFALWAAAAVTGVVAFPLHLLFEIPAALAGRPSDWRDLLGRLVLAVGALLLALLAAATGPERHRSAPAGYRPVAPWVRRWAYASVVIPVVGWALPHGLWVLGVPFGISADSLDDIRRNLSLPAAVAVTLVPPLAGLLVLGLVQRWGQQWGRHRVPRLLALIPAGAVSLALISYGVLSMAAAVGGVLTWADWAVVGTLFVFVGWGVALGVTTVGYHLATKA